jgi:hypothetical protein
MPLTLNVGVSKKRGLPDYGSVGATCNVAVELDAALLTGDQDGFQRQVRNAYAACARAVNEELARHGDDSHASNGPGRAPSNGSHRNNGRKATASQVRAIRAIASRHGVDLTSELHSRSGVNRPEDLTVREASELIDAIKPAPVGSGAER